MVSNTKNVPRLRFKGFSGEWEINTLGCIFDITSGTTPPRQSSKYFSDTGHLWVRTTDLNNNLILDTEEKVTNEAINDCSSLRILPVGTVLVAMYGGFNQIGRTGLLTKEATCNQALSAIKPNEFIIPYFLITYLNYHIQEWKNIAASSRKDPNITKKDVETFNFVYPKLKQEQQKIADFLLTVDKKIQQLKQKQQLLQQYKKGMMQKLFSQQIRFKDENGMDYPESEWKQLSSIADIVGGGTPETSNLDYWNGDIVWFTPTEIKSKYVSDSLRTITNLGLTKSSAKILPKGTVLFTSRATIGDIAIAQKECTTNQGFQSFICGKNLNNEFLYYQLTYNKNKFLTLANGSTFIEISKTEIGKVRILFPSLPEQQKIADFLSSIDKKIDAVNEQISQMAQFKQGLLQQLFV